MREISKSLSRTLTTRHISLPCHKKCFSSTVSRAIRLQYGNNLWLKLITHIFGDIPRLTARKLSAYTQNAVACIGSIQQTHLLLAALPLLLDCVFGSCAALFSFDKCGRHLKSFFTQFLVTSLHPWRQHWPVTSHSTRASQQQHQLQVP